MRTHRALVLVLLSCAAGTLPAFAGGNANFLLGNRYTEDTNFWDEDEDQTVAGVMVDFGREGWPIHLCLANMDSWSSDTGARTGIISEIAFGIMKVWESAGAVRPYVGGGLAAVHAAFETDVAGGDLVRDDTAPGLYVDGGVFWRTGRRFNIGLGVRYMALTDVEIQDVSGDADYLQIHMLGGFGWPRREKRPAPTSEPPAPAAPPETPAPPARTP